MAKGKELSSDQLAELKRQIYFLTVGIDALEGLGNMLPQALDDEVGITGEQVGYILKCIEYSLLSTQRKIVAIVHE